MGHVRGPILDESHVHGYHPLRVSYRTLQNASVISALAMIQAAADSVQGSDNCDRPNNPHGASHVRENPVHCIVE